MGNKKTEIISVYDVYVIDFEKWSLFKEYLMLIHNVDYDNIGEFEHGMFMKVGLIEENLNTGKRYINE